MPFKGCPPEEVKGGNLKENSKIILTWKEVE